MKGLTKKVIALIIAVVMAMASLVGCSSASIDNNEVVATVGDTEISLGVANFYIRYQQSAIESYYMSYYGDSMWTLEVDEDLTYEESIRESSLEAIAHLCILEDHMDEYNVSFTDEELAKIEETADAFIAANEEDVKKVISADKEIVTEVLKLLAIGDKMETAMTADVDTVVSDEEAAQKKLQYVTFSKTTTDESGASVDLTEDELAALKAEAEDFLTNAKANGSLAAYAEEHEKTPSSLTFDEETTTLGEDIMKVANELGEGEFAEVLETDTAYYVLQLTSLFDEDATATEKENIIEERKSERYYEIYDAWEEATEIEFKDNVLAKIDLQNVGVTLKAEETTEE